MTAAAVLHTNGIELTVFEREAGRDLPLVA
ncbi:hypothetical protein OG407_01005 [Streptomyces sp. NBC_01515]